MRAVREQRVFSLNQAPTGKNQDLGTVGYVPERFVSYLILPKSLPSFADPHVIGTESEVRSKAIQTARQQGDLTNAETEAKLLRLNTEPD